MLGKLLKTWMAATAVASTAQAGKGGITPLSETIYYPDREAVEKLGPKAFEDGCVAIFERGADENNSMPTWMPYSGCEFAAPKDGGIVQGFVNAAGCAVVVEGSEHNAKVIPEEVPGCVTVTQRWGDTVRVHIGGTPTGGNIETGFLVGNRNRHAALAKLAPSELHAERVIIGQDGKEITAESLKPQSHLERAERMNNQNSRQIG